MHPTLRTALALFGILWLAGCGGGDGGSGLDYGGIWRGATSHGGTVAFTVVDNMVTSFQIVDNQARVQITMPTEIKGNSFAAANSAGVSSPDSPAVSAQGTFDSETHATGHYSVSTWSGTFEAAR